MRVLEDSNLVVSLVKGDFALREQSLAAYRTWAQRLELEFQTFSIEYTQRSENRFADALATLGSQIPFNGRDTLIKIGRQEHSIVRILQGMYLGESMRVPFSGYSGPRIPGLNEKEGFGGPGLDSPQLTSCLRIK